MNDEHHYESLSQAINDLRARGYTHDFNLHPDCIRYASAQLQLHPEEFAIDVYRRLEGMSSTDDSSIVYAISSDNGIKGIPVDAYGVYAENLNTAMIGNKMMLDLANEARVGYASNDRSLETLLKQENLFAGNSI